MKKNELECFHGVVHSIDTHGCDGCCSVFSSSEPTNSAARNAMSEFERECYDLGWADSQGRIIKLLEEMIDACLSVKTKTGNHNASTLQNAIALIKKSENPRDRAEMVDSEMVLDQKESKSARSCGCKKERNE